MTNKQKGNYYQLKTRKWYEKEGYDVYPLEMARSIFTPKGMVYVKKDILASDFVAVNGEEMVFIQSKTNKNDVAAGVKEFHKYKFPTDCSHIKKVVVRWEVRAKEPTVREVE